MWEIGYQKTVNQASKVLLREKIEKGGNLVFKLLSYALEFKRLNENKKEAFKIMGNCWLTTIWFWPLNIIKIEKYGDHSCFGNQINTYAEY